MKFRVTVSFDVETQDYHECQLTKEGVEELVEAMFKDEADIPDLNEVEVCVVGK